MISLRPYQENGIREARQDFAKGRKRLVFCLPTGGGKTVIFSEITKMAHQRRSVTLVIVDRVELLKQTLATFRHFGIDAEPISAGSTPNLLATTFVAMIETLYIRDYALQPDLIIIDEAHMGNFKKLFERFPDARYLGFTATPIYSGKKHHMRDDYEDIIVPVQIEELIKEGFLVQPKYHIIDSIAGNGLKLSRATNEFTQKSLEVAYDNEGSVSTVAKAYMDKCRGERSLIYAVSIKHAKFITETLSRVGVDARCVHSKISDYERIDTLEWLRNTQDAVVVNVDVLTKGFDCPPVRNLIIARATASFPLYLQIVGRGARPFEGKERFNVIDLGNNIFRHGAWEDPIDWRKEFHFPEYRLGEGDAPAKECPACELWIHAAIMTCPSCGHVFEPPKKQKIEGEVVELDRPVIPRSLRKQWSSMTTEELCELLKYARKKDGKPYNRFWVANQLKNRNADLLEYEIACEILELTGTAKNIFLSKYE